MTNKEWLDYLAHNAPDELAAWFDAERITNQAEMSHMPESPTSATMQHIRQVIEDTVKRGVYGDTESENEDSRDKLESDAHEIAEAYNMDTQRHGTERFAHELYYSIIHLLNRQRAIDDSICDECSSDYYEMQEEHDQMLDGIAKLMRLKQPYTFDHDKPLENIKVIGQYIDKLTAERDELQFKLFELVENLNKANDDFESARAELTAERDELKAKLNYLKAHGVTISEPFCGGYEVYNDVIKERDELQAKVDELQAIADERWNKYIAEHLRADTLVDDLLTADRQCEQYRKKLSNVMDAVHEAYRVGS